MTITRRTFLTNSAVAVAGVALLRDLLAEDALGAAPAGKIRIGSRTGSFGGKIEQAKECGLQGVELGVGGAADKLEISDPDKRANYKERVKAGGIVVSSLSMDLMNSYPVASDPRAVAWLGQCIDAAKHLGAAAILVPFFGKAHILDSSKEFKKPDVDNVVARMKEVAPKAKDAGVHLGIECTLTAKQYLELLDRIGSEYVGAYYDIGNCTGAGYDVPGDIRTLKDRMCMIHFKDGKNFLGEGRVKLEPVAEALKAINYKSWIILETACPTKNGLADAKKNVDAIRKLGL
jgi:L-ribulose-5-phosphate 3-epimerase